MRPLGVFVILALAMPVRAVPPPEKALPKPKPSVTQGPQSEALPSGALARLGTTRFRTPQYLQSAVLSPDGKTVALAAQPYLVLLDARTGRESKRFLIQGNMRSLLYAPDGKTIATVDYGNIIRLWDSSSGQLRTQLQIPVQPGRVVNLFTASFSADGQLLAAAAETYGQPGVVHVWQTATGKQIGPFTTLQNQQVRAILSPDGKLLATWGQFIQRVPVPGQADGGPARIIQLWDLKTGKEARQLKTQGEGYVVVGSAAFSPDGKLLVCTVGQATVSVLDAVTGKEVRRLAGRRGLGSLTTFSPDGALLAVASSDGAVLLWETATWKRVGSVGGPTCQPTSLAFPADGRVLACGVRGQSISLWDVRTGRMLSPTGGHAFAVTTACFTAGGKEVLSVGNDGGILAWDLTSGRQVRRFQFQDEELWRYGPHSPSGTWYFSPDGKYLAQQNPAQGNLLRLWDVAAGRVTYDLEGPQNNGQDSGAFSPDSSRLAATGYNGAVHVWDLSNGEEVRRLNVPKPGRPFYGGNNRVALSPDGRLIAGTIQEPNPMGAIVGKVRLWDLKTGKEQRTIEGTAAYGGGLAFSPDGKLLAGSAGNAIVLWDVGKGEEVRRLQMPDNGALWRLAFSPDGRLLVGAGVQQAGLPGVAGQVRHVIYVWELATRELRARWPGHEGMVNCLVFSADGNRLVSGSTDTSLLLWDLTGRALAMGAVPKADALWSALASPQADQAFLAMGQLAATPEPTLKLFQDKLHEPAEKVLGKEELSRLIDQLDAPKFVQREKAYRALERLGQTAGPALREVIRRDLTPEHRRRVEKLLARLDRDSMPPEQLRVVRAVEVLERLGTPAARELLARLAEGSPRAFVTSEARAALARRTDRP